MNSNKAKEHHHIAKLVRALVSPSTPESGLGDVVRALAEAVRSPNDIIFCETIPDTHFLKREALAVRDAFEAATNGMTAPDAFQALEAIPGTSVFFPWKLLVQAILDFYAGDSGGARALLERIPAGSFPRHALGLWASIEERSRSARPHAALSRALAKPDPFLDNLFPASDSLSVVAEEISEALDEGMMDLCMAACSRLLRELRQRSDSAARQAALLILRELDGKGASVDEFLRLMGSAFGEAEALRLTALYLSEARPLLALLFFFKAGAAGLEADPAEAELAAWSLVIERAAQVAKAALDDDPESRNEFMAALEPAATRFFSRAALIRGEAAGDGGEDPFVLVSRIASRYRASPGARPARKAPARSGAKRAKPQLELFA
jgi:hypothetical protein